MAARADGPTTRSVRLATASASSLSLACCLLVLSLALLSPRLAAANKFEPYALNGGLVSAVAGRDFVIIASDTRLTDGGYQIHSRRYLGGRVWAASGPSVLDSEGASGEPPSFGPDGSLVIPELESDVPVVGAGTSASASASASARSRGKSVRRRIADPYGLTMVGSAGCASDCEALKRTVRTELSDRSGWASASSGAWGEPAATSASPSASTVATLLLHTLYARRSFPYYAFCVLAGLDSETGGSGQVHVYDAIGSHERVAVACAGTPGREMLQPILDRMFASSTSGDKSGDGSGSTAADLAGAPSLLRDGTAVRASGQRVGSSLTLRPPVGTCVGCGYKEAVALLVRAYRSVAEREIGVGDDLVVCVLRRDDGLADAEYMYGIPEKKRTGGSGSLQVLRFPLKKH